LAPWFADPRHSDGVADRIVDPLKDKSDLLKKKWCEQRRERRANQDDSDPRSHVERVRMAEGLVGICVSDEKKPNGRARSCADETACLPRLIRQ
jgi:hypothetical protein